MVDSAVPCVLQEDEDENDYHATDESHRKSKVDELDDGHKYGQKDVKRSLRPSTYYQCTYKGCSAKMRVVRDLEDPEYVITSYKGVHNHDTATSGAKTIHVTTGPPINGDSFCTGSETSGITGLDLGGGPARWGDSLKIGSTNGYRTIEVEEHDKNGVFPNCDRWIKLLPPGPRVMLMYLMMVTVGVSMAKKMSGRTDPRSYYKCKYAGCSARYCNTYS